MKIEKAIIFGVGNNYSIWKKYLQQMYDVVGLMDSDVKKQGQIVDGMRIISPDTIHAMQYDKIVLTPNSFKHMMFRRLVETLGVEPEKIDAIFVNAPIGLAVKQFVISDIGLPQLTDIGTTVNITHSSDEDIFVEVFGLKNYDIDIAGGGGYICIDIGMNVGYASLFFARVQNCVQVYSFEPFGDTYNKALENLRLNPTLSTKIIAKNIGLSNRNEDMFLASLDVYAGNSIYGDKGDIKITLHDAAEALSDIYDAHYGKQRILIKIDCEGSEYDVLESLDRVGLLLKTDAIIGEWHTSTTRRNGDATLLVGDLKQLLLKNNYTVKFTYGMEVRGIAVGDFYAVRQK